MAGDPVKDAFRAQLLLVSGIWTYKDTENPTPQPDIGARFVTIEWMDSPERLLAWGSPGSNLYKVEGFLQIHLKSPRGQGSAAAEVMARTVWTYFRARRFQTSESRDVRIVDITQLGGEVDGAQWVESLLVHYETFNLG
jgi:hypothetical protein